jgi:hypothetical protein
MHRFTCALASISLCCAVSAFRRPFLLTLAFYYWKLAGLRSTSELQDRSCSADAVILTSAGSPSLSACFPKIVYAGS